MKKRYFFKIIIIFFIFQLIFLPILSNTQAFSWSDIFKADDVLKSGGAPKPADDNIAFSQNATYNEDGLKESASVMYNALLAIGTILVVIVGGILGIQFMMASAEDKAAIKEKMIPYVIGSVVIFGAFGIWKLVVDILQGI